MIRYPGPGHRMLWSPKADYYASSFRQIQRFRAALGGSIPAALSASPVLWLPIPEDVAFRTCQGGFSDLREDVLAFLTKVLSKRHRKPPDVDPMDDATKAPPVFLLRCGSRDDSTLRFALVGCKWDKPDGLEAADADGASSIVNALFLRRPEGHNLLHIRHQWFEFPKATLLRDHDVDIPNIPPTRGVALRGQYTRQSNDPRDVAPNLACTMSCNFFVSSDALQFEGLERAFAPAAVGSRNSSAHALYYHWKRWNRLSKEKEKKKCYWRRSRKRKACTQVRSHPRMHEDQARTQARASALGVREPLLLGRHGIPRDDLARENAMSPSITSTSVSTPPTRPSPHQIDTTKPPF
ncbi:hypothetical protein BJY52DRAFT_1373844 [Lactarius psammicola]|nr:hypothetical protein BJY52DRAFT_1373844 [Lactarius psammicola]